MPNLRLASLAVILLALSVTACAGATTPPAGGKVTTPIPMQSQRPLATTAVPIRTAEPSATSLPEATTVPASLHETEWMLQSLNGRSTVEGTRITLKFGEERLSGYSGCNAYGAELEAADDGVLKMGEMGGTARACGGGAIMRQEENYTDTLSRAVAYRVTDNALEILDRAGDVVLEFVRKRELAMNPAKLIDTRWLLLSMDGKKPAGDARITLHLKREGRIGGTVACAVYTGKYEAADDDIRLSPESMDRAPCSGPVPGGQEDLYTSYLEQSAGYRLSGKRLEVITADGDKLVFRRLP